MWCVPAGWFRPLVRRWGQKAVHPDTGDITLSCEGFNDKNDYGRQTPCDQTTCAEARRTDVEVLHQWFNGMSRASQQAINPSIRRDLIGDGTYLFVPDNDAL